MSCPWCSSEAGPDGKHMDYDDITRLLFEYSKVCDIVRISGGEPTMHPDIDNIVTYCCGLYKEIILLTNGSYHYYHPRITKYYVSRHDSYTGMYISFLLKHNVPLHNIIITAVICPGGDVDGAIILSEVYKIPCHLYKLQRQGRAKNMVTKIEVTGENGCGRQNKITITHDGKVIKCSADKEGENCNGRTKCI